jgi:CubicO group peptidase (beta-lactamase class C family)
MRRVPAVNAARSSQPFAAVKAIPQVSLKRLTIAAVACACACAAAAATPGRAPSPPEIDSVARRAMKEFSVPGLAVGIVKDGQLVFARGYGVRAVGETGAVDADTVFAVGSNTKAFTTAAIAILVDEGKLKWDDRVIDHLPDFRMWDPYVTREFTIRDLLTHRSGLGLGAGDMMFVTPTDFTRRDLTHALRYLKPASSFRSRFAYDNLLYGVAGDVIEAVSGQSWEDFVTQRIFAPLHMSGCAVSRERLPHTASIAAPHLGEGAAVHAITPLEVTAVAPAGSIYCNVSGMATWVATQLGRGKAPDGTRLFSEAQAEEMWTPQTILPVAGPRALHTRTHFSAYGLGWLLEDVDGYQRVSHNGGLPGMVTHVGMLPELNVGVIVLTNQQQGAALEAVSLQVLEAYAGVPKRDWVALAAESKKAREEHIKSADAQSAPAAGGPKWSPSDLDAYVGTFADPWRGAATVSREQDVLRLTFSHTKSLSGRLSPVGLNLFIVRWDDRTLNADAYVRFVNDYSGKVAGFTMQAVSAATDFSFDFQDLDFTRTAAPQ